MLKQVQSQCTDKYLEDLERTITDTLQEQLKQPHIKPKLLFFNSLKADPVETAVVVDVGGSTARLSIVNGLQVDRLDTVLLDDSKRKEIFNWLAQWLKGHEESLPSQDFALTWAFPLENGTVTIMGKGFSGNQYCNRPVVDILNAALAKANSKLVCRKACHDGAACLNAGRLRDPRCFAALTWGSGVNVTFLSAESQIVNAEVCLLGQSGSLFTLADANVDSRLDKPGLTPFETMVGGVYLQSLADELGGPRDIWASSQGDPVRDLLLKRASGFVAAALGAVLRISQQGNYPITVACTGGVILFPGVLKLVSSRLVKAGHSQVTLFAEQYGSEVGSACSKNEYKLRIK